MNYIIIALVGALAALLANRGIAVFNDGFRPVVPQYFEGKMTRRDLAATSFAISIGLVIGFGLPTSIAASIILIHCILLTTDIIGTWCPDSKLGAILSAVIGGVYGVLLLVGLEFIIKLFGMLPVNFLDALGKVSSPVVAAFAAFPAIAVAYQHGFKKGVITGLLTFVAYFIVAKFGVFTLGEYKVALNAVGIAMLVGCIVMIVFAAKTKPSSDASTNVQLTEVFTEKISRIQKYWFLLAIMGGLLAAATSLGILAGDPISLGLVSAGEWTNAGMAAFARAIGFVPLVFTTAIVTGVYAPAGCTFVFVVGLFMHGNPLFAFVIGAVVMIIELFLIRFFARIMDKFPGVREMGEHIRTSMSKVIEVALLVGGVIAAEAMAPTAGALFVIACFLLNKTSKKPIVDMAVGPVAAIALGLILNVLRLLAIF